jgi:hypothetical protein
MNRPGEAEIETAFAGAAARWSELVSFVEGSFRVRGDWKFYERATSGGSPWRIAISGVGSGFGRLIAHPPPPTHHGAKKVSEETHRGVRQIRADSALASRGQEIDPQTSSDS